MQGRQRVGLAQWWIAGLLVLSSLVPAAVSHVRPEVCPRCSLARSFLARRPAPLSPPAARSTNSTDWCGLQGAPGPRRRLLVKAAPGAGGARLLAALPPGAARRGPVGHSRHASPRLHLLELEEGASAEATLRALRHHPGVEHAEAEAEFFPAGAAGEGAGGGFTPDDPLFPQQ